MLSRLTSSTPDRPHKREREPAPQPPHDLVRLQSEIGNRAVAAMVARWPFGGPWLAGPAAATHASTSPAKEYSGILHREVDLLANAKAIVAFLRAKRGPPAAAAGVTVDGGGGLRRRRARQEAQAQAEDRRGRAADARPARPPRRAHRAGRAASRACSTRRRTTSTPRALDKATGEITALDQGVRRARRQEGLRRPDQRSPGCSTSRWRRAPAPEKKGDTDAQAAVADLEAPAHRARGRCARPTRKGKARAPIARVTVAKLPPAAPNAKGVDVIALPVAGQVQAGRGRRRRDRRHRAGRERRQPGHGEAAGGPRGQAREGTQAAGSGAGVPDVRGRGRRLPRAPAHAQHDLGRGHVPAPLVGRVLGRRVPQRRGGQAGLLQRRPDRDVLRRPQRHRAGGRQVGHVPVARGVQRRPHDRHGAAASTGRTGSRRRRTTAPRRTSCTSTSTCAPTSSSRTP